MTARTILIFFLILSFINGYSQSMQDFEVMMNESTDQWLCQKFEKTYPSYFNSNSCPPDFNEFFPTAPSATRKPFIHVTPEIQNSILNLLLKEDCKRFIHLKALSDLYFPLFERKLEGFKLHEDYKYIPFVVSGLNSAFKGIYDRSGIWQLDYSIAKRAGLRIDQLIDERNIPDISTDIALTQLTVLNEKYEGDQIAVLAAYFSSVAQLEKIKSPDNLSGKDLYENLDDSTQLQIDLFYTIIRVFENLEIENRLMDYLIILNTYQNITSMKRVSFDAISDLFNIDPLELAGANPAYIGEQIPANYRGVPFIVNQQIANLHVAFPDSLANHTAQLSLKKTPPPVAIPKDTDQVTYIVKSGDVLGSIAIRYGVRLSDLKRWNHLKNDRIDIGQKLVIYSDAKPTESNKPKEKSPSPKPVSKEELVWYTVKSGDSLWLIAQNFPGVSAQNIMDWNDINDQLKPGQKLKIYPQK